MLKNDYFKTALISIIFSIAVLVVLPRIPIYVNNQLFKIDSYIGGYDIKIFKEKIAIDLRGFRGGMDVQGGKKIVLQAKDPTQTGQLDLKKQEEILSNLKSVVEKRLSQAGYSDYEVGVENLQDGKLYVAVPKFEDSTTILNLASGNGRIDIKKLNDSVAWDIGKASDIIMNPDNWVSTGIQNGEINDLKLSKNASGQDQLQIIFNIEGRKKFSEFVKTNLNKPFSINLNDSPYPVAVPVISQSLADSPESDPVITGKFPTDIIKDYLIQMKNPFSSDVTSSGEENLDPRFGSDFLYKYFTSLLVSLILVLGFFIIKFGKYGLISNGALILSLVVFLAFFKIFSLVVNTPSIVAFTLLIILLVDTTYLLLSKTLSNLSSDKPFNLALYQGFEANKEMIKILPSLVFIFMLILSKYSFGETKSFVLALMLGSIIVPFHYFYSLKAFLELFGDNK